MMNSAQLQQSKEKRQHGTAFVPYGYYECRIPDAFINVPMHWHSEFELNYVVEGSGEFLFEDERCILSRGDILILPPDMLHAVYPLKDKPLVYDAFVFHPSLLGNSGSDRCTVECIRPLVSGAAKIRSLIPRELPNIEEFRTCARKIIDCAKLNTPHYDLLLKSELLRFFWLLDDTQELVKKEESISYSALIRPALEYIQTHFAEEINVEQLAALLHLSKSYFMFCFKKAVGIGAIDYLTQYRINIVCEKLITTTLSVSEIALQSGYNNLSNFNRQFKKTVGLTPQEYRRHKK